MAHRLWSLLLVLLASSLVMTATVHARENHEAPTFECSGVVHSEGDADQADDATGGPGKATPHHDGTCHGQVLNLPDSAPVALAVTPATMRPPVPVTNALASTAVDPALRPPAA